MCASVALFSACEKDLDNNPTLQTPKTFTLNTPAYAAQTVDLKVANGLNFSWSQPDYGFPVSAEYGMQFSTTNKWTKSVDQVVDMDSERGDYAPEVRRRRLALHRSLLPTLLRPLRRWNVMKRGRFLQVRNFMRVSIHW